MILFPQNVVVRACASPSSDILPLLSWLNGCLNYSPPIDYVAGKTAACVCNFLVETDHNLETASEFTTVGIGEEATRCSMFSNTPEETLYEIAPSWVHHHHMGQARTSTGLSIPYIASCVSDRQFRRSFLKRKHDLGRGCGGDRKTL